MLSERRGGTERATPSLFFEIASLLLQHRHKLMRQVLVDKHWYSVNDVDFLAASQSMDSFVLLKNQQEGLQRSYEYYEAVRRNLREEIVCQLDRRYQDGTLRKPFVELELEWIKAIMASFHDRLSVIGKPVTKQRRDGF